MSGVIAAAVVAHVPTLSRAEITPDFQTTLVQGEHRLGRDLRSLSPDLWVIASTHWVSTFNWMATCQPVHEGICVADEAPDLVPGLPYRYRGDTDFANALVEEWKRADIPAARNDSPHYAWDYGTFVPLSHLDPEAEVGVVGVPVVLMADHAECVRAGAAVHATAKRLGRRVVFVASTALSHALVRGRHFMPTPERMEADQHLHRSAQAWRGGCRARRALPITAVWQWPRWEGAHWPPCSAWQKHSAEDGAPLEGRQYGDYAQSSGSGNANVVLAPPETLAKLK